MITFLLVVFETKVSCCLNCSCEYLFNILFSSEIMWSNSKFKNTLERILLLHLYVTMSSSNNVNELLRKREVQVNLFVSLLFVLAGNWSGMADTCRLILDYYKFCPNPFGFNSFHLQSSITRRFQRSMQVHPPFITRLGLERELEVLFL